ncbi:MAG: host attachment protein [Myxococcota bacterium]
MSEHGLIVADAGRARFFLTNVELRPLDELLALIAPEERLPGAESMSDAPGRKQGSTLTPRTSVKDHREDVFARRVAEHALAQLEEAERWIVVAPPQFLGRLRSAFDPTFLDRIVATLARDYSRLPTHELSDAIREALPHTRW